MSQALNLFRLQQVDSHMEKINLRLINIQSILDDNGLILMAKDDADRSSESLVSAEKLHSEIDDEIKNLLIKIDQTESNLYSGNVKNPRELQDLQNELIALKKYLIIVEEKLLNSMVLVDENKEKWNKSQTVFLSQQTRWAEQTKELINEQSELKQEIKRLGIERQAISKSILSEHLILYEQLREKRKGIAVCTILDNACSACGTTLTLSMIQKAHSPEDISFCPTCGRFLYGH